MRSSNKEADNMLISLELVSQHGAKLQALLVGSLPAKRA
jgi:hypothetical protein